MNKQLIVILGIIVCLVAYCFVVEPNLLKVTKYKVEDSNLAGVKIVFLADLHLKPHDFGKLKKVVKLVKEQKPDAVIIGGDFAFKTGDKKKSMDMNIAAQILKTIYPEYSTKKNIPIFAVCGNYDNLMDADVIENGKKVHKHGWEIIEKAFSDNQITLIKDNSRARIKDPATNKMGDVYIKNRRVDIIGIADIKTKQPDTGMALRGSKKPRIVVTHNPDIYYDILDDVSLILAGHTHGGQFILPFTQPLYVPSKFGAEFASGLIQKGKNKMIVTTGVGTSRIPVRFNCRPEIVVVEFTN